MYISKQSIRERHLLFVRYRVKMSRELKRSEMFLRFLAKAPIPQQIAIFRTITEDQLLSIRICCYYLTVVKVRLPPRYKEGVNMRK